ncbi:MAG: hypothetical protein ACKO3C_12240 [Betaproteobacteria bacterium]
MDRWIPAGFKVQNAVGAPQALPPAHARTRANPILRKFTSPQRVEGDFAAVLERVRQSVEAGHRN